MKNNKIGLMAALVGALAMTACSSDDSELLTETPAQQQEIRLVAAWGDAYITRAISDNFDNIFSNQRCYVWGDLYNPAEPNEAEQIKSHIVAWEVKAGTGGALSSVDTSVKPMFPGSNQLNFYAMHGTFADGAIVPGSTAFPAAGIEFQIADEQMKATDYFASDLLYAKLPGVLPTPEPIELPFYHILSQVKIFLKPGDHVTAEELQKAEIYILNGLYHGQFKPAKDATVNTPEGRRAMLTPNGTDKRPIKVKGNGAEDYGFRTSTEYVAAVVMPQDFDGDFLEIRVPKTGSEQVDVFTYKVENLETKSGMTYIFNLTVNDGKKMTLTPTLEPWQNATGDQTLNFGVIL